MKRLYLPCAVFVLALLAGCPATLPQNQGQSTAQTETASFNNRAAVGLKSATAALQATTLLLQAGKISVAENNRIRTSLDLVVASLKTAQGTYANNADQATALLVAALNQLAALKAGEPK